MNEPIIDSAYSSLEEALVGSLAPKEIQAGLHLFTVQYISYDSLLHQGQVVVDARVSAQVQDIFRELLEKKFPIYKVVPIAAYAWDDEASMQDNNTSAFNYRKILATDSLSNHSLGLAIDINPKQNPYFAYDGNVYPMCAVYDVSVQGTIHKESDIVKIFMSYGWAWLGEREENKDYQHFEKYF